MAGAAEQRKLGLHFWVKTELVVEGRMQSPPPGVGAGLGDLPIGQAASPLQPGDVTRFLLAGWVGGGSNKSFSVGEVGATGLSRVRLALCEQDPDTVKLSVSFNMVAPKGQRNCHLASSFITINDLMDLLDASPCAPVGGTPCFTAAQRCFSMRDNFTKNAAVLRFVNVDTDVAGVRRLPLRASSLRALDRTNAAIFGLGQRLKAQISTFAVSPLNAGPQYMEAFSYLQMQNCLVHYSILGHAFDGLTSPVQLPWLMYDAYQAAHLSGIHPAALSSLADVPFVIRFGQPLVTAHTACSLSSIYCTDYAVNAFDVACKVKETEDMAKTFGCLSLQSQAGLEGGVPPRVYAQCGLSGCASPCSLEQCVEALASAQKGRRELGLSRRLSFACLCDDCENASMGIMMKARALMGLYRAIMGAVVGGQGLAGQPPQAAEEEGARRLADAMGDVRAGWGEPWGRLFAHLTREDHLAMAAPLLRLGGMVHRGDWVTAFTVVSAKGPAYTEACPSAPGALSGHGTVVGRIRSSAGVFHGPLEGTTHLCQDPPLPAGVDPCVRARLEDGSVAAFDHSEFATVFAQNVHKIAGASADYCALSHIRADYGDAPQTCPFYVAAFYSGLSEGNGGSLGCVPLDTKPPASFGAGAQPVFGAPVLGLSQPTTMAVPITTKMLSDDAGEQRQLLDLLAGVMQEAYCPEASQETVAGVASYWQPVSPLRSDFECLPGRQGAPFVRRKGFEATMRSINTWAFDDPAHAEMAVRLYGALATRFNTLQAQDLSGDGVTAAAFGHYLSAALRFDIPMRPVGGSGADLSTFRNLKRAVSDVGITPLVACPLKMAAITARARVKTDAHFYMCDRGEGPVHAHRVVLA